MASILVDYENVQGINGLKGIEYLEEDDTLIIFYSESCKKIKSEDMNHIIESRCEYRITKLRTPRKNALDFYIAVECGVLAQKGMNQIIIVSKDKGFQSIIDYFQINSSISDTSIVKADTIENGLLLLNTPDNLERRKIIKEHTHLLDINEEFIRMQERQLSETRLKEIVKGTEYEDMLIDILSLVENKKADGNKVLYISSLQSFGKKAGTEIYRLVKSVV